ncbi:MAG: ABC transporter ATP-binding protein [Negativicutes bacterium]|nr:ABC transporter ATP-binding protein [Negativicutes bacterium]
MVPLIEFHRVYKVYTMGETVVRAIDGISLQISQGEFVAIVGPSGSGKTTCMNIIGCLDVPDSGQYLLGGQDVGQLSDNALAVIRNKMIGFVFQQYNLLPRLTVEENVEVSLIYAGVGKQERIKRARDVLSRVGLSDKLKSLPNQLSGGQQQRVSIARALVGNPSVILADEPTGALDSKTGMDVLRLLQELHQDGNTVVLITHDNGIAAHSERTIRLSDGKIIYDGPTQRESGASL